MIRGLVTTSVQRKVTVFMCALAVMAFGAVSLSRLSLNLLPDISYPSITVQTDFPDTAPGEVENLITKPIEEEVGVLKGLQEIHSVSRAGSSEVTLEFAWGADLDELSMDIREKLDRLLLPDEAEDPIVLRYDPALDPIMRLALSGADDMGLARYVAERQVKNELEKLEGVASAQLKGGVEDEIQVNIDQGKVAAMGISPSTIAETLRASNINRPGGSLRGRDSQYLVRTLNEYDTVAEIGELTISPLGRPPVKLKDVAEVKWGVKDREEITRVNGQECVVLDLFKEGDANTVRVAGAVKDSLESIRRKLPDGMTLEVLSDQSRFIERSIQEVRDALLIGGALAIIILLVFLRDIRSTIIIATAIPLSVVAAFILMYQLEVSLNIMSLGGLTLGIGMLVDGAIVVLESIYRYRESGLSRKRAAVEGAVEVGGAVFASVLTTVAVFFPIVFVEGIAGQLFRDQSLTVTFSLLASLVVAMSLIPMLAGLGRDKKVPKDAPEEDLEKVVSVQHDHKREEQTMGWFSGLYERLLRGVLHLRWVVMLLGGVVLFATARLVPQIGTELIPTLSEGEFYFDVTMPEGTSLPATSRVMARMEQAAMEREGVGLVYSTVGTKNVSGGASLKTRDENLGQVSVVLENRADDQLEAQIAGELRDQFAQIPNLDVKVGRPSFFSLKTPVEVLFFSEDLEALQAYTTRLKNEIAKIDGLKDVRASMEAGNPELTVVFDRDKLARLGLTIEGVTDTLHTRVTGDVVSQFKEADRQIDIRLRNRMADRDTVSDIENAVVGEVDGMPVMLKAVARLTPARGPSEIHRIQQSRVGIITGEPAGRALGGIIAEIEDVIAANPPPPGITSSLGGQNKEMKVSFDSLRFAMLLAVFLVYLVMAATFENLIHPFIILFTIPFALVGAVLGLYFSGATISVISLIGAIFLVGVIVNNAIVLVDAINRARREGFEKREAIVHAAKLRLRPILMTTLTTVLGLLPMAVGFGEGAELRTPLAVVVTTGLVVGTVLTLFIIPAAYMIVPTHVTPEAEEENLDEIIEEAERLKRAAAQGI